MGDQGSTAAFAAELLGYVVILGSLTVKLPIIRNVVACKDPECLSLQTLYLECLALTCSSCYSFRRGAPLSTYAELISVFVQNVVIVSLLWMYAKKKPTFALFAVGLYVGLLSVLLAMDETFLVLLPFCSTSIGMIGQIPQIIVNFRNGHTGALSIITQTLNVLGGVVRIFTTFQLVKDLASLVSVMISTSIQLVLFFQIVTLKGGDQAKAKEDTKKTK